MSLFLNRRSLLATSLVLPLAGCNTNIMEAFGQKKGSTTLPRSDRMIRWLLNSGRDNMMSPEALNVMGLQRPNGMDIPVKQISETGADGRYTLSLTGFRNIWEFIFHWREMDKDLLLFHHADQRFARLTSVRFQRGGRPTIITDGAFAEQDFQRQYGFWVDRMPGR